MILLWRFYVNNYETLNMMCLTLSWYVPETSVCTCVQNVNLIDFDTLTFHYHSSHQDEVTSVLLLFTALICPQNDVEVIKVIFLL